MANNYRLFQFLVLVILATTLCVTKVSAGPPYVTDDPEPVELRHWEVYIASQLFHDASGSLITAPHIEVNYGVIDNLQLHIIVPDAVSVPITGPKSVGLGNIELGAKYRFVQEGKYTPEIATFPLIELPTANQSRGLGDSKAQYYVPIWMQKGFGKWTFDFGGGYWITPGLYNENYGFVGGIAQYQVIDPVNVGLEVYHQTPTYSGGTSRTYINVGTVWDISPLEHFLFSAGHTMQGQSGYEAYMALQFTFGPEKEKN